MSDISMIGLGAMGILTLFSLTTVIMWTVPKIRRLRAWIHRRWPAPG